MGGHSRSKKNARKAKSIESAVTVTTRNGDCSTSGSHHHHDGDGTIFQGTLQMNSSMFEVQVVHRLEIFISELEINVHHENRVLTGNFCVDPFVIDCVYTVLEDREGNTVRVLIDDDGVTTSTRKSKALARYSKGKLVRILDPFYKTCEDGGTVLKVENCRNIVGEDEIEMPEQKAVVPQPAAGTVNGVASTLEIEGPSVCREVERLRVEGNVSFSGHDWKGALIAYSECITKCLTMISDFRPPGAAFVSSSDFSEGETVARILLLAYSNRSETWLRLHDYDKAQCDACMALDVDPKHVKSLNRKGKALLELQLYEEAGACFSAALQESPGDATITANYAASKTSLEQSRDGNFDLNDYLLSCLTKQPPQCSEFVGPVEVRWTTGGMRGLFATKDVVNGELLLVSNAVAWCDNSKHRESDNEDEDEYEYEDEEDEDDDDEEFKRCGTCEACEMEKWDKWHIRRRRLRCLEELREQVLAFAKSSRRRFYQVASLAGLCRSKHPPVWSMDLYRPGSTWTPSEDPDDFNLEAETLRDIVRNNSMEEILNDPRYYVTGQQRLAAAMWVLPSIMNHSCCPNSETWCVGKTIFVRANRAISAGEELTRAYFDILKGLEHRQGMALGWPFKCNCPRCKWESNLSADQAKLRKKLDLRVSQLFRDTPEHPTKTMAIIAHSVACVEDSPLFQGLEGKYRHWMRASVMDAYIAYVQAIRMITTNRIHTLRMALISMVEVGGGFAMRPQMASTLLRDVKRKCGKSSALFRSTEALVMDVYKPYYGDVNKKTFGALVRMSNMDCLSD